MNISSIDLHADNGVKMTVNLYPTATAIAIRDRDGYQFCAATIYLPVADYERAQRAVEAFNREFATPSIQQEAE